jgi:hypothetical protein
LLKYLWAALLSALIGSFVLAGPATAGNGHGSPGHQPIGLCHDAGGKKFVFIHPDASGAYNGHAKHSGDIIPAFSFTDSHGDTVNYPGQNLDTLYNGVKGSDLLANGCKPPHQPPPGCGHHCPPPPGKGTIVACKALVPSSDSGRFDLKVDNAVVKSSAGDGDCGGGLFNAGGHVVSEAAAVGSNLGNYSSSVECVSKEQHNDPPGTSIAVTLHAGETIMCTFTNVRKPASPGCPPGSTGGTPPFCHLPCPKGTTEMGGACVVVVVKPCPCNCPHGGHHKPPKHKCPKVKKSQFRASITPTGLMHGLVHLRASAPKSAHVKKIVAKLYSRWHGKHYGEHFNKRPDATFVKKGFKMNRGLWLYKPKFWGHGLWGPHKVVVTFFLKCGKKVVVTFEFMNNDPPKGWVVIDGWPVKL